MHQKRDESNHNRTGSGIRRILTTAGAVLIISVILSGCQLNGVQSLYDNIKEDIEQDISDSIADLGNQLTDNGTDTDPDHYDSGSDNTAGGVAEDSSTSSKDTSQESFNHEDTKTATSKPTSVSEDSDEDSSKDSQEGNEGYSTEGNQEDSQEGREEEPEDTEPEEPEYEWVHVNTVAFPHEQFHDVYDYVEEGAGSTIFYNKTTYTGETSEPANKGEYFEVTAEFSTPPETFKQGEIVPVDMILTGAGDMDAFYVRYYAGAYFDKATLEWGGATADCRDFTDENDVYIFYLDAFDELRFYETTIRAEAPYGNAGDQIGLFLGSGYEGTAFLYELQEIR